MTEARPRPTRPRGCDPRRLGEAPDPVARPDGVRVVLDLRPLQKPDRGPVTAAYLEELLAAYAAEPLTGESFTFVLQAGLPDPSEALEGIDRLDVAGRRWLPPTHLLRSGALTLDPFLLRTASLGSGWRARSHGAAGVVYHAAGGAAPIASRLPLVVSLLDVAPWELPEAYQRTPTARFGQRLRARILQRADAVIVPSNAGAAAARRLLHVRRDRISIVPLAAREAFRAFGAAAGTDGATAAATDGATAAATDGQSATDHASGAADAATAAAIDAAADERRLRGVPDRYFVYTGRYDARQDLTTLLRALQMVAATPPAPRRTSLPWPPHVLLVGATTDDRADVGRTAAREGVGELLSYAPRLEPATLAALIAGSRAVLVPALSDAAGLGALDALAVGSPVVGTTVGALPEIVGRAGILAEPRDADRLAAALRAAWSDEAGHGRLVKAAVAAGQPAGASPRTWSDVARETREIYARVASRRG